MSSSYNDIDMTGNTSFLQQQQQSLADNSFLGWMKWFFFNRYMLIILILAFLGINLLSYLDSFVRTLTGLFRPILALFGYTIGETAKESVKIVKAGSKGVIDVAAGTLTGGINMLEKGLTGKNTSKSTGTSGSSGSSGTTNKNKKPKKSAFPQPDDSGSRTQASKATTKAGYCYIGEDRGFRSCIQVSDSDTCMSGDIFPTQEICINPTLRQ